MQAIVFSFYSFKIPSSTLRLLAVVFQSLSASLHLQCWQRLIEELTDKTAIQRYQSTNLKDKKQNFQDKEQESMIRTKGEGKWWGQKRERDGEIFPFQPTPCVSIQAPTCELQERASNEGSHCPLSPRVIDPEKPASCTLFVELQPIGRTFINAYNSIEICHFIQPLHDMTFEPLLTLYKSPIRLDHWHKVCTVWGKTL